MWRVAIYAREAPGRAGQARLDRQVASLAAQVARQPGWCHVATYADQGAGAVRPGLSRMLADAPSYFDLMVADWHVGAESGLELVAWVRAHPRLGRLPVLLLSGHERLRNRDVALAAGADEFMEKPISARGLLICLLRLLSRRAKEEPPA